MELSEVVTLLDSLAPPSLAESWDNVGLLLRPSSPLPIRSILLTIDLTPSVLLEAISLPASCSSPTTLHSSIPSAGWEGSRGGTASWPARWRTGSLCTPLTPPSTPSPGGSTTWLAGCLGHVSTRPLTQSFREPVHTLGTHRVGASVPQGFDLKPVLSRLQDIQRVRVPTEIPSPGSRLSLTCDQSALVEIVRIFGEFEELRDGVEITRLEKVPVPGAGMGRFCRLSEATSLLTLVDRVKERLGLTLVRLVLGNGRSLDSQVTTAAVCAGSGGSVLEGVKADMYLTGEMSHHQLLDASARGTSIILCEHTNSERGYLPHLASLLTPLLGERVTVHISNQDRDPVQIV
ncbi:NIF3-like protein 1 [Rhinoraja longicauda]